MIGKCCDHFRMHPNNPRPTRLWTPILYRSLLGVNVHIDPSKRPKLNWSPISVEQSVDQLKRRSSLNFSERLLTLTAWWFEAFYMFHPFCWGMLKKCDRHHFSTGYLLHQFPLKKVDDQAAHSRSLGIVAHRVDNFQSLANKAVDSVPSRNWKGYHLVNSYMDKSYFE